jgi:hypothetical protein
MWVSANPQEAINVQFDYKIGDFQDKGKVILQTQIDDNERRTELVKEDFRWAAHMYEDMFG